MYIESKYLIIKKAFSPVYWILNSNPNYDTLKQRQV